MDLLHVVVLSVIEGVTEFLPISSTGHQIIAAKLLNIPQSNLLNTFEIVIQSGAILAVLVLYLRHIIKNPDLLKKILAAFIPTGIIGFLLYKLIKTVLLNNVSVVGWSLFLGGVAIIAAEYYFRQKTAQKGLKEQGSDKKGILDLSYPQAIIIGFFQSLSVIPGVSRSAASIIGALFVGMDRSSAVEFSFLLAVPTMLAASGYELLKSHKGITMTGSIYIAVGTFISFIVALFVVKWFLGFVRRYDFIPFGIYRIIVGMLVLFFLTR